MPREEHDRRLLEALLEQLVALGRPAPPPFPQPSRADPYGCVAQGGRLTPELVLDAYRQGIFPMGEREGELGWWCPDPRTIIDLDLFHVPRRLQRTLRQERYAIRVDTACRQVIAGCADRPQTWITPEIARVFLELHEQGHVHSIEAWRGDELAGGLYGVALGGAFMAESMFHRERDASKVAVVALIERLGERGYRLLDIQYPTRATSVFRPRRIRRAEYLARLREALRLPCRFV